MSVFSIIVNILAAIALIIIISYIIYYIYGYWKNKEKQQIASIMNPPGPYMQNSGIKCPDYWVNTGVDPSGNYICKNSFNIPTVQPTRGFAINKCNQDSLKFQPITPNKTWEINDPNGLTSYTDIEKYNFLQIPATPSELSRCQWINNCGPASNTQGIWSGVNEICNNPPPIS